MKKGLIPFGIQCRSHRSRRSLVMADQAKALRCSVAYISAIERGARQIPEDYPASVARWLELTDQETRELQDLAAGVQKVVHLFPADSERAQLALDFADSLNNLPIEEVRQLRKRLRSSEAGRHRIEDVRRLAALARQCFEIGNKLSFDLMEILESKLLLLDPDFYLQVDPDHILGDQLTAYSDTVGSFLHRIVLSEFAYGSASNQKPDGRRIAAHELAHWFLHPHPQKFTEGRQISYQAAEIEAERFVREFLLPEDIVKRFSSPGQLAMVCDVPRKMAAQRMKEIGIGDAREERRRVNNGFSTLLTKLNAPSEQPASKSVDKKSWLPARPAEPKLDPKAMLTALGYMLGRGQPEYAGIEPKTSAPTITKSLRIDSSHDRAALWFQQFGWR